MSFLWSKPAGNFLSYLKWNPKSIWSRLHCSIQCLTTCAYAHFNELKECFCFSITILQGRISSAQQHRGQWLLFWEVRCMERFRRGSRPYQEGRVLTTWPLPAPLTMPFMSLFLTPSAPAAPSLLLFLRHSKLVLLQGLPICYSIHLKYCSSRYLHLTSGLCSCPWRGLI